MIKGFKGTDENLKCRGFQYEVGKDYEEDKVKCCHKGFHFCENPLDVFGYYPPAKARYFEVEGDGQVSKDNKDSKVATSKIHIGIEVELNGLINAGVKFILDRVNWKDNKESNTGYYSAATNTGDQSAATNTGDQSAATNTGYHSAATNTGNHSAATNTGYQSAATNTGKQSAAIVEGKESIAVATGLEGKAKGSLGCYLVLTEWYRDDNYDWHIKDVKSAKVDGKIIEENIFYQLKDGEFVEYVEDEE